VSSARRAYRLDGPAAAAALDLLHVHADVFGAVEDDAGVTVWLAGPLPGVPLPAPVREPPPELVNATATGREDDRPIVVAEDLIVRPPWVPAPPSFSGIELVVPRANAFGSGEHGSTQAALCCLHAVWDDPASFADVGTGSGILACYAAQRRCPQILACDLEREAVAAALELLPGAVVSLGGPESLAAPADLVVANLGAAELHTALAAILQRWTRRSPFVLSGMRPQEVAGVTDRLPFPIARQFVRYGFMAVAMDGGHGGSCGVR
jgi:hypothetical protein